MRVFHILSSISNASAGPTYSVAETVEHLNALKIKAQLITTGVQPTYWPFSGTYKIIKGRLLNSEYFSWSLVNYLHSCVDKNSVFHGHGIWRFCNLFPLWLKPERKDYKIVWSPRGMMSSWSMNNGKLKKKIFWALLQKKALARVDCFHATSYLEYEDIRRLGFKQPVAIIPNGVTLPPVMENVMREKIVLFLGGIHEKKGLHILLNVWSEFEKNNNDWQLYIVGSLKSEYGKSIQQMSNQKDLKRVKFLGELVGEEKEKMFWRSGVFVLPSYSENFGMSIAESLAHALPVITTDDTPWNDLSTKGCGWVGPLSSNFILESLVNATALSSPKLQKMGMAGRCWMQEDFDWNRVAKDLNETYEWLLGSATKPIFVLEH